MWVVTVRHWGQAWTWDVPVWVSGDGVRQLSTQGGGGGGGEGTAYPEEGGEEDEAKKVGSGEGFGGLGRVVPVGYIVLEEGGVKWKRIVDFDHLALLSAIVPLVWLLVLRYWIKAKLNT